MELGVLKGVPPPALPPCLSSHTLSLVLPLTRQTQMVPEDATAIWPYGGMPTPDSQTQKADDCAHDAQTDLADLLHIQMSAASGIQWIYLEGDLAQKKKQPRPECHLGRASRGACLGGVLCLGQEGVDLRALRGWGGGRRWLLIRTTFLQLLTPLLRLLIPPTATATTTTAATTPKAWATTWRAPKASLPFCWQHFKSGSMGIPFHTVGRKT
ncbi:MAG: hypothetical protein FRX49_04793 [Trebouxia sp. A1-2]|nr:MAG: hypothetical protein FRX49_04793 [Trebouxia sp. A1-2]